MGRAIHGTGGFVATYGLLLMANAGAWLWAWMAFAGRPTLLGTALLAYAFGLRHAFDADHIAAIDNVVRKLIQQRRTSYSVGLYFSLGHSTVVVLGCIAFAAAAATLRDRLDALHSVGSIIGTAVSALFLLGIGVVNLFVLRSTAETFARAREGAWTDDEALSASLAVRGPITRLLRPLFDLVSAPSQMYPVGLLFGLGFDTATEIGLLSLSAKEGASGLSLLSVLVFPALFTAGMSLMDTTDSALMSRIYGWALVDPLRKLRYNLTITAASAATAILIGGVETLGLIGERLALGGCFWNSIVRLNDDLGSLGYAIVAVFLASWMCSTVLFRIQRSAEPSTTQLRGAAASRHLGAP
jgi:nickel/cobalt transporter (NiCoT) family protein